MLLDGLLRQAHPVRDLLVLETIGHELEHGLLVGDPSAPDAAALGLGFAVPQYRRSRSGQPLCVLTETFAWSDFNYT